jgi:hypothetical protein
MLYHVWGYRASIEQRSDHVVKGSSQVADEADLGGYPCYHAAPWHVVCVTEQVWDSSRRSKCAENLAVRFSGVQ